MKSFSNRKRRFLVSTLAATIAVAAMQTPANAAPRGPAGLIKAPSYERPTSMVAPLAKSVSWCQPGNDGRLKVEFAQPDPLDLSFNLEVWVCNSTWLGPKLGASTLKNGVAQLEIMSGPETWTTGEQPVDGVWRRYGSEYFDYAPAGTYVVRAQVKVPETGAVVYSDPISVNNRFQRRTNDCPPSSAGTRSMRFSLGLGALGVNLLECVERWLDGPRPIFREEYLNAADVELTLIDPAIPLEVTYSGPWVNPSYEAVKSLAPGPYLFQARYTGPGEVVEPVITQLAHKTSGHYLV